jgi:hypothetical protein
MMASITQMTDADASTDQFVAGAAAPFSWALSPILLPA